MFLLCYTGSAEVSTLHVHWIVHERFGSSRWKKALVYPSVPLYLQVWTTCVDSYDPQRVKCISEWISQRWGKTWPPWWREQNFVHMEHISPGNQSAACMTLKQPWIICGGDLKPDWFFGHKTIEKITLTTVLHTTVLQNDYLRILGNWL